MATASSRSVSHSEVAVKAPLLSGVGAGVRSSLLLLLLLLLDDTLEMLGAFVDFALLEDETLDDGEIMMQEVMKNYQELQDALCVSVKIDHGQQIRVIVNDLRNKRKHCSDTKQVEKVKHFDFVLKYYLGDEDFKKYVIDFEDLL